MPVDVTATTARPGTTAVLGGEARVVDAALRCIARWGLAKTTLDDVAREAGCSRATIYRLFPGGKDSLTAAVVDTEVSRFFAGLTARLAAAPDLEDLVVAGVVHAARHLAGHGALQYLVAAEPGTVLPAVAFSRLDAVLATVAGAVAPDLAPHVGEADAPRAAEWLARVVLTYALCPAPGVDLTDEVSARRLLRAYVLPGLLHPGRE